MSHTIHAQEVLIMEDYSIESPSLLTYYLKHIIDLLKNNMLLSADYIFKENIIDSVIISTVTTNLLPTGIMGINDLEINYEQDILLHSILYDIDKNIVLMGRTYKVLDIIVGYDIDDICDFRKESTYRIYQYTPTVYYIGIKLKEVKNYSNMVEETVYQKKLDSLDL